MRRIQYAGESGRQPSAAIWADCPVEQIAVGSVAGVHLFEDFINFDIVDGGVITVVGDGTIAHLATEVGGVVRLDTTNTDNDEQYIAFNDDKAGMLKITKDGALPCWFEARIRTDDITKSSLIVGMMNEAECAADLLADTQTDAAILDTSAPDFIGFIQCGDSTVAGLDAIYMDQATTGAHKIHKADAQTLVVDTWYNVGWRFDGANVIRYYVDGAQVGVNLAADKAEVPDGEELLVMFGCKTAQSVVKQLDVDWVKAATLL